MEFLIEELLDLILEGSIEVSSNKKVPRCIRYPLIVIIILFFSIVIFGLLILGIALTKENLVAGILIILFSLILLIGWIVKFRKIYFNKRDK